MKKILRCGITTLLMAVSMMLLMYQLGYAQAPGVFSCGVSGPESDPCVIRFTRQGNVDTFEIEQPIVDQEFTVYDLITFFPGDTVFPEAGGCVQTGGAGQTWKRYVDPSGPNSDELYFGRIHIPGVLDPTRFDQLPFGIIIPKDVVVRTNLILHYEDDEYGDNGYWGHDNGTGNQ